jgi:hypothetical protein
MDRINSLVDAFLGRPLARLGQDGLDGVGEA